MNKIDYRELIESGQKIGFDIERDPEPRLIEDSSFVNSSHDIRKVTAVYDHGFVVVEREQDSEVLQEAIVVGQVVVSHVAHNGQRSAFLNARVNTEMDGIGYGPQIVYRSRNIQDSGEHIRRPFFEQRVQLAHQVGLSILVHHMKILENNLLNPEQQASQTSMPELTFTPEPAVALLD